MKHSINLVILAGLLLLSGCQNKTSAIEELQDHPQAEAEFQTQAPSQTQVQLVTEEEDSIANENTDVTYCYHNGVVDETVYFLKNAYYINIDGLKDKDVQQKVNGRIRSAAQELYDRDLPPYRGIRALVAEEEEAYLNISMHAQTYYNESNIYSLLLLKTIRSSDYSVYIEDTVALNFDLRTGKEITIADLFTDGYEYQSVISEYVRTCISENQMDNLFNSNTSEYSRTFTLLLPFDKIAENQKFIITSWNEICLLLDYETREFDVGTMVRYLPVYARLLPDKGKEFAFTKKYETWNDSLYRNSFERWKSLKIDPDERQDMWISDSPGLKDVQFHVRISNHIEDQQLSRYFSELTEQIEERAAAVLEEKQLTADELYSGDYYLSARKYGKYMIESESYSFWSSEGGFYDSRNCIYDAASGQEITLADCFIPGINYQEIIVSLAMAEDSTLSRDDLMGALKDTEFMIYPTYFMIPYMRMDSSNEWYESSIYIDFRDIGEEKLTVFD